MSSFCPNINSPDYKLLSSVIGDDLAHKVYEANKGNSIDLAPNGKPSILFNELLKYTRNYNIAATIKSNIYWSGFTNKFGDWINDPSSVSDRLDINGEPKVSITGYTMSFMDQKGRPIGQLDMRPVFDKVYDSKGTILPPTHPDPRIQADINKYGKDVITDWNNSYVWDLEGKYNLIDHWYENRYGLKQKLYRLMSYDEALQTAKKVRNEGAIARVRQKNSRTKNKWYVESGVLIGREPSRYSVETFDIAGIKHAIKMEDVTKVMKVVNQIASGKHNAVSIIKLLKDNFQKDYAGRSDLQSMFDLILQNEDKLKHIGIHLFTQEEEIDDNTYDELYNTNKTYMEYDPGDDSIRVNASYVVGTPNMQAFIEGILHEAVHGITERALIAPQDQYDRQFKQQVISIYNDALDQLYPNTPHEKLPYGYKNVKEFVSVFMTSDKFASQLKGKHGKDNIWQHLITSLTNLLRRIVGNKPATNDLYQKMHNVVDTFMSKQSKFGTSNIEINYDTYTLSKAEAKKNAKVSDEYYRLSDIAAQGTQQSTFKALNIMQSHIHSEQLEDGKHVYLDNNTGKELKGVHQFMKDWGYEYSGKKPTPTNLQRSIQVGKAIHYYMENKSKPIGEKTNILIKTGYKLHKNAQKQLDAIYDEFIAGKDVKNISEAKIYDPEKGLVGIADILSVNEEGNVIIWDFKTATRGFERYTKGKAPTMQDRYRFQLSLYKHMLEKALHRKVASMNLLLMKYDVFDDEIQNIEMDTSFDAEGVDRWFNEIRAVKRTYGEDQMNFTTDDRPITSEEKAKAERSFLNTKDYNEEEVNDILSKLDDMVEKIKDRFEKRLDVMRKRYPYDIRKQFEEFYEELSKKKTTTESVISIVKYAHTATKGLYDQYKKALTNGQVSIELLARWREYASVYDVLDKLQDMLVGEEDLFSDPLVINLLDSTIKLKNKVKSIYETEGIDMLSEFLSKYYDGIRATFKENMQQEYRRKAYKLRKQGIRKAEDIINRIGTMGEYIDKQMQKEKLTLDERTTDLLKKELIKSSKDANQVGRWLDNLLDTSDPIAAAVTRAFVTADDEARDTAYSKRREILDELRSLEKSLNKGKFQSAEDFYGFMLEQKKNPHTNKYEFTQYRLRPWYSELLEEERVMRNQAYNMYESNEANAMMRKWRNHNMPLDKTAFNQALYNKALELNKAGILDISELEKIDTFVINGFKTIQQLAKDSNINNEAANQLIGWINDNRLLFSNLAEKWVNPQWDKFMDEVGIAKDITYYEQMQELKKSSKPIARWYSYIDQLDEEANNMLPYNYHLNGRLPGIARSFLERIKSGQSMSILASKTFDTGLFLRPEDTEHGEQGLQYEDEQGRVKYFLPIHYTNKIEPDNQSYDLAGIYFRFWESANDYKHKRKILPEIELAKHFINKRSTVASKKGNRLLLQKLQQAAGVSPDKDKKIVEQGLPTKEKTVMADMFNDWFEMAVYGRKSTDKATTSLFGSKKEFDVAKFADLINKYTSLNLLSLNVVQGVANVAIGETLEAIEAFASEYVSVKSFTKATGIYTSLLPALLGQSGRRNDTSLLGLLIEKFDILDETPIYTNFDKATRLGQAMSSDTLFLLQHAGEHFMQSRFMIAHLLEKKAYDRNGKELKGSMFNYYYVKNGELELKPEVDLRKSHWTKEEQAKFKQQLKGRLSRMHGEYSDLGRVAIQRLALGRMAYMFRKFLVPGLRRRWGKKTYIERLGQTVEGNYLTFGRFVGQLTKDMVHLNFALMSEDWSALSNHERANVKRTAGELSFLFAAIFMANMLFAAKGGTDDPAEDRWLSFLSYQAYRLKAELTFYVLPGSAMQILRSPMASMSVIQNLGKLSIQILNPGELYKRGPWKGQLKLKKDMIQMVPMYRQYYRLRDMSQQVSIFKTGNISIGQKR